MGRPKKILGKYEISNKQIHNEINRNEMPADTITGRWTFDKMIAHTCKIAKRQAPKMNITPYI
ncbi:MAG: hypothetical protein KBS70_04020 [Bacteroidales bacterium]|nr:hypothetical protein [Candidatus Colicola equi]